MTKPVKINILSDATTFVMQVDGLVGVKQETFAMKSPNGKMGMILTQDLFPFISSGDMIFVSLTLTKVFQEAQAEPPKPGLILPGGINGKTC